MSQEMETDFNLPMMVAWPNNNNPYKFLKQKHIMREKIENSLNDEKVNENRKNTIMPKILKFFHIWNGPIAEDEFL